MSNLVPYTPPTQDASNADEAIRDTKAMEMDPVQAGQYWTTSHDVPAKTKTSTRKTWCKAEPGDDDYDAELGSDQPRCDRDRPYTETVRSAIPAATTLLVRHLHWVDDELHTIELSAHPGGIVGGTRFLINEFFENFEREFEADAIRQREMQEKLDYAQALQTELIAGPPRTEIAGLLTNTSASSPSVETAVEFRNQLTEMSDQAQHMAVVAQDNAKWLQAKTEQVGQALTALTPFYNERASAALATIDETLQFAKKVQQSVVTLGLYTGENVEVRRLVQGESAPASEPITFFQSLLYLEEEYAIYKMDADADNVEDFAQCLNDNPELRDRVLPTPRCVVLMRYRRRPKTYYHGDSFADHWANAEINKKNFHNFLLIRDGENITQVFSEITTDSVSTLFPTKDQQDRIFKGVFGEEIKVDDLKFSDHKAAHEDYALTYKRMLLMLWGLNDREQIFGEFYDAGRYKGFFNEDFQHQYLRFVNDLEGVLESGRPSWYTYAKQMNSYVQSGSRVAVFWNQVLSETTCPTIFKSRYSRDLNKTLTEQIFDPKGQWVVDVAKRKGTDHYIDCPVSRTVYPRDYRPSYEQTTNAPVFFDKDGDSGWLCLDLVKSSDIEYYLHSRRNREAYMSFFPLFTKILDYLREQEAIIAPIVDKMVEAIALGKIAVPEGIDLSEQCEHAIRLWRAAHRGALPPSVGDVAFNGTLKTLLNSLYVLLGNNRPTEKAEQLCADQGRTPLRLVMTGKNKFALYTTSVGDEVETRLEGLHPWVTRLSLEQNSRGLSVTNKKILWMPAQVAQEETLHEWDTLPEVLATTKKMQARPFEKVTYDQVAKAFAAIEEHAKLARWFLDPGDEWETMFDQTVRYYRDINCAGTQVSRPNLVVPVGIKSRSVFVGIETKGSAWHNRPEERRTKEFAVLNLRDDPFFILYLTAKTDEQRERVEAAVVRPYANKETHRAALRESVKNPPRLTSVGLQSFTPEDPWQADYWHGGVSVHFNWADMLVQNESYEKIYHRHSSDKVLTDATHENVLTYIPPVTEELLNAISSQFLAKLPSSSES